VLIYLKKKKKIEEGRRRYNKIEQKNKKGNENVIEN